MVSIRGISLLVVLLVQCYFEAKCRAESPEDITEINFAINSPGSAPYLYFDGKTNSYQGVVVDLLSALESNHNYRVSYLDSSRARSEQLLHKGVADAFLSGIVWLDNPERFIYSDTVMMHSSYIYSTKAFNGPFVPEAHPNASVCTRYGFIYPVLQKYFDRPREGLLRVNSSSQTTMAIMLSKGRCDYAIMSEQNALSIMFDNSFCATEFYQSSNIISNVELLLVIRPERAEFKRAVNQTLVEFIRSGSRDNSIDRHSGVNQFPKPKCTEDWAQ